MTLPPLSKSRLLGLHRTGEAHHIPYVWGAKPDPRSPVQAITGSDCSGWVRWLVHKTTGGALLLPEGSDEQHDAIRPHLSRVPYADAAQDHDNLYIAFIAPKYDEDGKLVHPGHVWLVMDAVTLECHGGVGVGHRRALAAPLPEEVCACYHWPGLP